MVTYLSCCGGRWKLFPGFHLSMSDEVAFRVNFVLMTMLIVYKVQHVYYPGLPSHPEHHIAKQQMTGFGGVVSFEIDGDLMATINSVDALKIPYIASSFGGYESIVDQPAIIDLSQSERMKYGIKDNLVRFSFGVEDFKDLKADVFQALETK
ncbi:hypothetical protein SLEP1_g43344 [Rubroshorea leprosula]|uniref:Cystathionine gamma-synthase n=1 Tax=Rubroshorea leprosula TaxID=152421 RepID=A0AAV5LD33_9ROSI|nr:hypothetical protein SLEP1_g43344 [Rubroshorea leprosula]